MNETFWTSAPSLRRAAGRVLGLLVLLLLVGLGAEPAQSSPLTLEKASPNGPLDHGSEFLASYQSGPGLGQLSLHNASGGAARVTRLLVQDSGHVLQPGPLGLPPAFALQPDLQGALSYAVWLQSTGGNSLAVARVLRDTLGLGLAEATSLAAQAPVQLASGLNQAAAGALVTQLTDVGALAPLRGTPIDPVVGLQVQLPLAPVVNGAEVWLDSAGANQLAVINVIRTFTGLGLSAAQALVNAAPVLLSTLTDLPDAEAFAAALTQAGAQAHLQPTFGTIDAPIPLPPGSLGIVPDFGLLLDYRGQAGNPDLVFDLPLILGALLPGLADSDLDGLQFALEIQDANGSDLYLLALPAAVAISEPGALSLVLLAVVLARPRRKPSPALPPALRR